MPHRIVTLLSFIAFASAFLQQHQIVGIFRHPISTDSFTYSPGTISSSTALPMADKSRDNSRRPKLVIFDLDGCLWRPEMYELIYFMGNSGAPFTPSKEDPNILLSRKGEPVYLLGDVREVLRELHQDPYWQGVPVGISSRTNEPNWARELLEKFVVECDSFSTSKGGKSNITSSRSTPLSDVFDGPIEIASDSKIDHFYRIQHETKVAWKEMIFLDNEIGNCEMVASLGVSVGYCPGGVTKDLWDATLKAFPCGEVIQLTY
jgi:magnesium-dependent phosphatase 1